jgi:hypothetical protein
MTAGDQRLHLVGLEILGEAGADPPAMLALSSDAGKLLLMQAKAAPLTLTYIITPEDDNDKNWQRLVGLDKGELVALIRFGSATPTSGRHADLCNRAL